MKRYLLTAGVLTLAFLAGVACKQDKKKAAPAAPVEASVPTDSLATEWISYDEEIPLKEYFSLEFMMNLENLKDERLSQEVRDRINAAIGKMALGEPYGTGNLADDAARKRAEQIVSFTDEVDEVEDFFEPDMDEELDRSYFSTSYWHLYGKFEYTAPEGYVNYYIGGEEYHFGAAHGYYYATPIIFDLRTGLRVCEEDLFNEGYQEALTALLDKYVQQIEYYDPDMILVDEIEPNDNFELTTDGLSYYYNPYEIAPYAVGLIQIDVPADAVQPLLREPFTDLWK